MKTILFALSLFFISALAAVENVGAEVSWSDKQNQVTQNTQECCPQKTCEPCCPKPKPPICCECYVPNYYDLQCDTGMYIYGDFLYWYAREDNLSPCQTVVTDRNAFANGQAILAPSSINYFDIRWDPGFRAAIGYNYEEQDCDIEVNYTWFHDRKRNVFSVPGFGVSTLPLAPAPAQLALLDPWINTSVFPVDIFFPFLFNKVNAFWRLSFNQVDLELGKKFWLSKHAAMRTYAGLRGAWFTTIFRNTASNLSATTDSSPYGITTFSDQFKSRIWGVGLLAGIQPEWHFRRNFILFSNLDAALLWGRSKLRKREDYTSFNLTGLQELNYHHRVLNQYYKMQAVLDLAIGFRWEETWCGRMRTALDIGWENHIWFAANQRFKNNDPDSTGGYMGGNILYYQSYNEEASNLMFGGPMARFRIDF